jgi:DNA-binding NarL/FixJ family response regulator
MSAQSQERNSAGDATDFPRRIVVLEDESLVAALLTQTLQDGGFQVVSCHDAVSAKKAVQDLDPDGVLIDINLGEGPNGLQFGEWLTRTHPHIAQIYLTGISDPRVWSLGQGKASLKVIEDRTYLSKDKITNAQELRSCVDAALQDDAKQRLSQYRIDETLTKLSKSELEILSLAAEGLSNAAIATKRGTTTRTVEQQLQAVYKALKLEITSETNPRVQAVRIYLKASGV